MIVLLAATQAMFYAQMVFFKQHYHTSALTGQMWVTELLGGNTRCIKVQLGMDKHVFVRNLYTMNCANHSQHVYLAEKVANCHIPLHHDDQPIQQESWSMLP